MSDDSNKRERFAYHQAGHAVVLLCLNGDRIVESFDESGEPQERHFTVDMQVEKISLPDELPEDSSELPLPTKFDDSDRPPRLMDRATFAMAGLEAERMLPPDRIPSDVRISKEFTTHDLDGFDHKWNVNVTHARHDARMILKDNLNLLETIAKKLIDKGELRWGDLLTLKTPGSQ